MAKSALASLKADVDKIDIDKLKTSPANLSKISNVVGNNVVKKPVYDKLVPEINVFDTGRFVLKAQYSNDKLNIEKKIGHADKKIPYAKEHDEKLIIIQRNNEIGGKLLSIKGLANTSV